MILADLGQLLLILAFACTVYATVVSLVAARRKHAGLLESSRVASILPFPILTAACLLLVLMLINGNFEVAYVTSVSSRSMPTYLRVTALWGGQQGSLLFWSWLSSLFIAFMLMRDWRYERDMQPYVIATAAVTLGFYLILNIFYESPFQKIWIDQFGVTSSSIFPKVGAELYIPPDGNGLNPLLRHPGMIIHPPMLYLGFIGLIVPFCFAIGALAVGRQDDVWIRASRRWTLVAWLFLSLGLVLGGRWAYDVLGWGGYWAWDPVEIAAFMPWLTATAFVHSVIIQEKRGMFKHWNMVLIILTYALVVLGTFLTRTGVLSSVHAFAESSLGVPFFVFLTVTLVGSLALLIWRWNTLQNDRVLSSWLSREGMFLLNNIVFMAILATCFWGVIYPIISEAFTGQKITVGPPFYERTTGPMFALMLLLMGVAPLTAWTMMSIKRLGQAIWKPAAFSLLGLAFALVTGVRNGYALLGIWLCTWAAAVNLYEFHRGAIARRKTQSVGYGLAMWQLLKRDRRRYGGYMTHIGIILMAIGIIGLELFQTETQGSVAVNESLTLQDYTMTYKTLHEYEADDGRLVTVATVDVYQDGEFVTTLQPRRDFYFESRQAMTIPGVHGTIEEDFYVLLVGWKDIAVEGATFKLYHNPLVNWLWFGGLILILGIGVASWPERREPMVLKTRPTTKAIPAAAD